MGRLTKLQKLLRDDQRFGELLHKLLYDNHPQEIVYFDNADMKRIFNVSDATLYRMRRNGTLPHRKVGRKLYYSYRIVSELGSK